MSEEGEFKRRIREHWEPDDIAGRYCDFVLEGFTEWVEEAQKEFPVNQFEYKEPVNFSKEQYRLGYIEASRKLLETIIWFVKWFGSSIEKGSVDAEPKKSDKKCVVMIDSETLPCYE